MDVRKILFYYYDIRMLEPVTQGSCRYPIPRSNRGQIRLVLEQPNPVEDVLAWAGMVETLWSLNVQSDPEYESVSLPLILSTVIQII